LRFFELRASLQEVPLPVAETLVTQSKKVCKESNFNFEEEVKKRGKGNKFELRFKK
jgi:hypothetical protein